MDDPLLNREFIFETENLIVGAGVAGIALAQRLNSRGRDFLVIEKSKSVGGRLATRRDQAAKFDHGAQFLKQENQSFGLAGFWSKQNLLTPWFEANGFAYACSSSGMNSLVKKAAEGFANKLLLNTRLKTVQRGEGNFTAELEVGSPIKAQRIYLTCPLPQSLKILSDSGIEYDHELNEVRYASALVGLIVLRRELLSPEEVTALEAVKFREQISESIASISNQNSKGISDDLAFTVVMTEAWSERRFDDEDSIVLHDLSTIFLDCLAGILNAEASRTQIDRMQLKKWRYSHPLQRASQLHSVVVPGLILLGDAFGGASINGALRSTESIELV